MRKENKHCVDCDKIGVHERRRCEMCAKEYNRKRERDRRKINGRHNFGIGACAICNNPMTLWRKDQTRHARCRYGDFSKNDSRAARGRYLARKLIKTIGVEIPKGFCVHHIDHNPLNNLPENLMLMSRSDHTKLHVFIDKNRSLLSKDCSSNFENCWDILRDRLTTTWLETAGVNVIKISDIGQSAAKPPNSNESEEGSETMYERPKSQK